MGVPDFTYGLTLLNSMPIYTLILRHHREFRLV
jgi:hypothetical protein